MVKTIAIKRAPLVGAFFVRTDFKYICAMQLSVVILNYNVRHFLELCLHSVTRAVAGIEAEIIILDNASPDDSCEMVKREFPNVILIENAQNTGFPAGNNAAVRHAKGRFLCVLNPDTVVAEDTFVKMLSFFTSHSETGMAGCRLIDGRGGFLPESKRGVPTPWVALHKIAGLHKIWPSRWGAYYAMHIAENQQARTDILVGAFMFMETALYREMNGFDEQCFMYADDIDLSYRVLQSGRDNYYVPQTTVVHFKGESTVRDQKYLNRFRDAMQYFYRKHFGKQPVFDFMMRVASYGFALAKMRKTVIPAQEPTHYYWVTSNAGFVVPDAFQHRSTVVSAYVNVADVVRGSRLCFDTATVSYFDQIRLMEALVAAKCTFRFLCKGYLLGSDSSDARGEVQKVQ